MGEEKNQVFENREVRLIQVKSGAWRERDVKNEGRSGYVHENTGEVYKMSSDEPVFPHENAPIERSSTKTGRVFGRKSNYCMIIRAEKNPNSTTTHARAHWRDTASPRCSHSRVACSREGGKRESTLQAIGNAPPKCHGDTARVMAWPEPALSMPKGWPGHAGYHGRVKFLLARPVTRTHN